MKHITSSAEVVTDARTQQPTCLSLVLYVPWRSLMRFDKSLVLVTTVNYCV
jgi:hypothetical protein